MNNNTSLDKIGMATGLLASFLLFVGGIVNDNEVSATSQSSTIASALVDNQTKVFIGAYMTMLGVFFFIWFLAYIRHHLHKRIGEDTWLVSAGFGGGLVGAAMILLATHFSQATTILSSYGSETQVAKALHLLEWNWYLLVEAPALAVMIGAISIAGSIYKVLPWWLTWWGILLALILLIPFVTGSGIMITYLWLAAFSIRLLVEKRKPVVVGKSS